MASVRKDSAISSASSELVRHAGTAGGALAVLVSVVVAVTLPLRDVDYNALNLFTLIVAMAGGLLAIRGSRRVDGSGLEWGTLLLLVAMLPAAYGWVALLYLPSLVLMVVAATRFIMMRPVSE